MIKTLWLLFVAFIKIGTFGYGGGPSMIPLIQREVVQVHGWMDRDEFIDVLGMGNALPGPIAIKMAAYIGYRVGSQEGGRVGGVLGAAVALLAENIPGLTLMFLLGLIYWRIKDSPRVTAALNGAKPAVVGLLLWTTYDLALPVLRDKPRGLAGPLAPWDRVLLALSAFVLVTFFRVHPAWVIAGAAVIGFLIYS